MLKMTPERTSSARGIDEEFKPKRGKGPIPMERGGGIGSGKSGGLEISEKIRNRGFDEGFKNFKDWLEKVKKERGLKGGNLMLDRWGSGDASEKLYLACEDGGGPMTDLDSFSPEGLEWYFQTTKYKGTDSYAIGLADELADFLKKNNIEISMKN